MTIDLNCLAEALLDGHKACLPAFADGASISRALPWLTDECSRRWLGDRLFFFPSRIPDRKRIAVVSSRMRQRLDLECRWLDLVRTAVLQCDSASESLVVANDTASCSIVSRAAALFGRPVIRFDVSLSDGLDSRLAVREWLARCVDESIARKTEGISNEVLAVSVSPELRLTDEASTGPELSQIPLGDRLLFTAADRIQVVSCRAHGHVQQLTVAHLRDDQRRLTPLWIASQDDGGFPAVVADLPMGWVPWIVESLPQPSALSPMSSWQIPNAEPSADSRARQWDSLASSPLSNPEQWLLHWTRTPRGPWPGESDEEFMDALILRSESADRTALATLLRIVREGKLIASSTGIRGGYAVVSFTEVPLSEFRTRRIFRKHRNRFDFEPWGVAIRKQALQQIGVRPVIYGSHTDWPHMDLSDRAFFQKATHGGATSNVAEREQRSVGDVDLRQFPGDSVCIFVDNADAADQVSLHCDWPVLIVPGHS